MKRYLAVRHMQSREIAHRVDVTGKSERHVERVLRGMLMNIGPCWFVDDITEGESGSHLKGNEG